MGWMLVMGLNICMKAKLSKSKRKLWVLFNWRKHWAIEGWIEKNFREWNQWMGQVSN